MGLDPVVAHRDEPDPGLPARAERGGDRREGVAGVEHLGADQVGGGVAVAETEPVGLDAVGGELLLDHEGLVLAPPAALGADPAAERVHDGVEVRAHLQTEQPDVVTGVADDGDGGRRGARRRGVAVAEVVEQAAHEAGPADAAGQHGDAHGADPVTGAPAARRDPLCARTGRAEVTERDRPAPEFTQRQQVRSHPGLTREAYTTVIHPTTPRGRHQERRRPAGAGESTGAVLATAAQVGAAREEVSR